MAKKPKLLLLDANAVFAAFKHGVWDGLCRAYAVILPSTVVHVEGMFYDPPGGGRRVYLDLPALVASGSITEYSASAAEVAAMRARFRAPFRGRIDDGEAEAIVFLLEHPDEDVRFVTADKGALQAVAMLRLEDRAMCLAEALERCGLGRALPEEHGAAFFRKQVSIGLERFITREGLA
ncbi:MAG TPA: hypothetical protein VEX86_01810 [Longimicrobium sp.]|nr:hypothetical protein [Longimicrobium sp.]